MKGLVFTYLVTFGGAAAGLFSPFWGLLAFIIISIMRPTYLWHWAVPQYPYSFTVGSAMLVGWLFSGFGTWKLGRGKSIVFCLLGYWLWSVVCAVFAEGQQEAWAWIESLAKIVLPFLVGVSTIDSLKKVKILAWTFVFCHGYLAFEFNMSLFAGYNRLLHEGFGWSDNNCIVIALVISLGLAFFLGMETPSLFLKTVAFTSCALMGHAVLFSLSRGGMLATAAMGTVIFCLIRKKPQHYAAFALAAAGAIYLAGPQVRERLFSSFLDRTQLDASAQSRLNMWRDAFDGFKHHPIFGVGPRNWPLVAQKTYGWISDVREAHNLWLQVLVQVGIPGFLFLAGFYGQCILKLWPLATTKEPVSDPRLADPARMVIAAMSGFLVGSQFLTIESLEMPFYLAILAVSILRLAQPAGVGTDTWPDRNEAPPPPSERFPNQPNAIAMVRFDPEPIHS